MTPETRQGQLFVPEQFKAAPDTVFLNGRCAVRTRDGHRAVLVAGVPTAHFAVGDRMAEAYAIVTLVEEGWASQTEAAQGFGCSTRTVRRYQRRFEEGGMSALGRSAGYPKGRDRLAPGRGRRMNEMRARGLSNRGIAERMGVTEKAVRKVLHRLGWKAAVPEQAELPLDGADPNVSAPLCPPSLGAARKADKSSPEPATGAPGHETPAAPAADPNVSGSLNEAVAPSFDTDPADRRLDRLLAYLGLLDDASPLFRSAQRVPRAGVLLALPVLVSSGVLDCAREIYGSIGPAFYGLRTSFVAMLLMALLRIKRPEGLKEHAPDELGRLLGLDRAPEVKTLRRKLRRLASFGRATDLGRALAERRVRARGAAVGFLYVDGHVRVYHGLHRLPKAHVARMRIALPATTDYWVNDISGDPLLVITAEANAGLVKMLPPILSEVRKLVGERRTTIVFDRGGYSPRLFKSLLESGFDLLTYRKAPLPHVPASRFHRRRATIDGVQVRYVLADQRVRLLDGSLRLRQVTRLSDDGHQTPILTSRTDLRDIEVAYRMFERWRQENFFKYLREEYALDALVDYDVEPADPAREVPNPLRNALDADLRVARAEVTRLSARYGLRAFVNPESARRTMRGFKVANAPYGRELLRALQLCVELEARRARMPSRVPVRDVVDGPVVKLDVERKHLSNLVKMVAYQAESDLVRMVAPHYKRVADEGRTLIQTALASAADLDVADDTLRVTLAPLSSAHRSRAIAAVCDTLNRSPVVFPGTRLRLHFAVADPAARAA